MEKELKQQIIEQALDAYRAFLESEWDKVSAKSAKTEHKMETHDFSDFSLHATGHADEQVEGNKKMDEQRMAILFNSFHSNYVDATVIVREIADKINVLSKFSDDSREFINSCCDIVNEERPDVISHFENLQKGHAKLLYALTEIRHFLNKQF